MPSFSETMHELKSSQKSAKGAPAYSRFINRRMGRVLAAASHCVGLNPAQVTGVSAVFSIAGIGLIAFGPTTWLIGIAIAALLIVGYAFDSADGQVARLQGTSSRAGEWLDHTVDCFKVSSLHAAVLIGLYGRVDEPWLLIPLLFIVVDNGLFFSWLLRDQLAKGQMALPSDPAGATKAPIGISLAKLFEDYGVICLLFLTWSRPTLFLATYGVILGLRAVFALIALPKRYIGLARLHPVGVTS